MNLTVDAESMRSVLTKALFDNMTEEQRADIMKGAIESLLKPTEQSAYGKPSLSAIEVAMRNAAKYVAEDEAKKRLSESKEFNDSLDSIMSEAVKRLVEGEARERLLEKIVEGTLKAFDRY